MVGSDNSSISGSSGSGQSGIFDLPLSEALWKIPVGIGILRNRVILELNDRALAIVGYARDEIIGKNTRFLFMDQAEYDRVGAELYPILREKGFYEMETRYRRKDGNAVEVLIRGSWLDADAGAMIFTVADISYRKRIEHALEARVLALSRPTDEGDAQLRFEDVFDIREIQRVQDAFARAVGVASLITDSDGRPITEPSNFCRLCADVIRKTEKGRLNCMHSDALLGAGCPDGVLFQPCFSGGLWDGGAPIMVGDRRIAKWLVGQVLDDRYDRESMRGYAAEIGADQAEFDAALSEVQTMSRERFAAVCEALNLIARQLSTLAYNNVQQARAIAERKRTEGELRAALEEKEALFRELKHRVKNSMALMAGLVGLESSHAEEGPVRDVLESMRARMESFAALYELLGGEGKPDAVSIESYLPRIIDSISESFVLDGRIVFSLDIEAASLHARIAAPIGLIVMELVTNALKYAFPNGARGTVSVFLRRSEDGGVSFSVADDGIGLPEGFDASRDGGLGMELVGMLAAQFKGRWRAVPGKGARFEIDLPAQRSR